MWVEGEREGEREREGREKERERVNFLGIPSGLPRLAPLGIP